MGVSQQQLPDQRFKVAVFHLLLQFYKQVAHFQIGFRFAAVEPALHHIEAENKTLGIAAKVPLPELELGVGHDGLQLCVVKAGFCQGGQHFADLSFHSSQVFVLDVLNVQHEPGLQHAVVETHIHFLGKAGGEDRLRQGGLVGAAKDFGQDLGGDELFPVSEGADDLAEGQSGLAFQSLARGQFILGLALIADCRLHDGRRHALGLFVVAQVFIVDDTQGVLDIQVTVQEYIGVGGGVEPAVAVDEGFVGQVGNGGGIAAGLIAIGRFGEQQPVQTAPDLPVSAGISALHFVEHNALVACIAIFIQFVVPAFLVEDFGLGVDQRTEYGI